MSQPYLVGLDDSRGRPLISVCAGAAHTLASTALLCRQQSLDEPATRALEKVASGPLLRGISVQRQSSVEFSERRRAEDAQKLQKKAIKTSMITMFGAIIACEQNDVEALNVVLDKNQVDVCNTVNGNYEEYPTKWTLLDIAINLNNVKCALLLQEKGAIESFQLNTLEKRKKAVAEALDISRAKLSELKKAPHSRDQDKRISSLQIHLSLLRQMKDFLEKTIRPKMLQTVSVEAISHSRALIQFTYKEPQQSIVIKFKIQWSDTEDFKNILGEIIEPRPLQNQIILHHLEHGKHYYFMITCIGVNGESKPMVCWPGRIEITNFDDGDNKRDSWTERLDSMNKLMEDVDKHRQSLVWQRVFPTEINGKKRKNGFRELFSASTKLSKHASHGVYLAALVYTEGKVLVTVDDCVPIVPVDENVTTVSQDDHHWLIKMSMCWDQINGLMDNNPNAYSNNVSLSFRNKLYSAAFAMQEALGIRNIGHVHYMPLVYENCFFLLTVRFIEPSVMFQSITLRWMSFNKLLRKKMPTSAIDNMTKQLLNILNFYEASQIKLQRGLYVGYLKLHSSLNSIRVVVPDVLPSMLPFTRIRDNPHLTREEWEWIKSIDMNKNFYATKAQERIHSDMAHAIHRLLNELDIDPDLVPGTRLYHAEIIQPDDDTTILLILPRSDDVCSMPSGSNKTTEYIESKRQCTSVPMPIFDMIHFLTYQTSFLTSYCKLNIFLEHFVMISQYEQRKCLLENDSKVYRNQTEILNEFQKRLEEIWQNARWISRVASEARDKHAKVSKNAIPLTRFMTALPRNPEEVRKEENEGEKARRAEQKRRMRLELLGDRMSFQDDETDEEERVMSQDPNPSFNGFLKSEQPRSALNSPQQSYRDIDSVYRRRRKVSSDLALAMSNTSLNCINGNDEKNLTPDRPIVKEDKILLESINVIVGYDCQVPKGTKIALSVTQSTEAGEVVNFVLEQIAKSAAGPDHEISLSDNSELCLVAAFGQRERRLKDEAVIQRLDRTWLKGNFLIRRKDGFLNGEDIANESIV
uniref:Ras-associating domain-containing protein n=1 Tax=Caenorhabditis japonica TaxID=281687 RepID=A0A8R1HMY2_CAEJA